jgi:DNA processing protein
VLTNKNILTLLNLPRVGRATVKKISNNVRDTLDSPDDYLSILSRLISPKIFEKLYKEDILIAERLAEAICKNCEEYKITMISFLDDQFPRELHDIPDAPVVLFGKGNLSILNSKFSIAVIGTRKPTEYGLEKAREIGLCLAEQNIPLISGLAVGCDFESQFSCVENNGTSIGILAHGLDTIAPLSSSPLADKIISNSGCLLSEYPIGTPPRVSNYVERNRIQSGLSKAVIVIETGEEGGSMETVKHATKQKRPIFCLSIPEAICNAESNKGNSVLIREKIATPIQGHQDLVKFIAELKRGGQLSGANSDNPREPSGTQADLEF